MCSETHHINKNCCILSGCCLKAMLYYSTHKSMQYSCRALLSPQQHATISANLSASVSSVPADE